MLVIKGLPMSFAMFLLACFVMGFGHGTVDSYQTSFLADLNRGKTARHMGALHGIFGIGGVLTPIILHEMLKSIEWRTIYFIVGVVCFILVVQFAVVTRYMRSRISVANRIETKLTTAGIKEFFQSKYSVFLLFCIFFGAAAQSGIIVWTIRYISVSLDSPEIAAICLSIFWITTTVSRFCSPLIPARPSKILAFGAFISAVTWTAAIAINQPLIMCVASGITGLASGSCIPMTLSEGAAINPEKTGLSTNILMAAKTLGQILSPIIVAFVMSLGTMQTGMYVTSALFIINGIFAALMIRKKQLQ
jgi:fucose permease